jgi:hypothetical protein
MSPARLGEREREMSPARLGERERDLGGYRGGYALEYRGAIIAYKGAATLWAHHGLVWSLWFGLGTPWLGMEPMVWSGRTMAWYGAYGLVWAHHGTLLRSGRCSCRGRTGRAVRRCSSARLQTRRSCSARADEARSARLIGPLHRTMGDARSGHRHRPGPARLPARPGPARLVAHCSSRRTGRAGRDASGSARAHLSSHATRCSSLGPRPAHLVLPTAAARGTCQLKWCTAAGEDGAALVQVLHGWCRRHGWCRPMSDEADAQSTHTRGQSRVSLWFGMEPMVWSELSTPNHRLKHHAYGLIAR